MKKVILLSFLLISIFCGNANAAEPTKTLNTAEKNKGKVEVLYFHFTRRCITCRAIEAETQTSLKTLYPKQSKRRLITFKSLNLDEKTSETLARKYKVEGQSLLIISGNKQIDLTDKAFMYAKGNPEKFKQELKKTIDPIIN